MSLHNIASFVPTLLYNNYHITSHRNSIKAHAVIVLNILHLDILFREMPSL